MKSSTEMRPWGLFETLVHNKECTVKILTIYKNQALSLQYHKKRDEYWLILEGHGLITLGIDTIETGKDDSFIINKGTHHTFTSLAPKTRILEVSMGDFDELDIVRLEDKYGRASEGVL